jgi:hypothetical protein
MRVWSATNSSPPGTRAGSRSRPGRTDEGANSMTAIVAGTPQAHARHSRTWGPLGLLLSMARRSPSSSPASSWRAGRHQLAGRDRVGHGRRRGVHAGRHDGPDHWHDPDGPAGPARQPAGGAADGGLPRARRLGAPCQRGHPGDRLGLRHGAGWLVGQRVDRAGVGCGAVGAGAADVEHDRVGGSCHPGWPAGRSRAGRHQLRAHDAAGILVSHLVWRAVLGPGYAAWPLG